MVDFPLFEVLLYGDDPEWSIRYSNDSLSVHIKPFDFCEVLKRNDVNSRDFECLKSELEKIEGEPQGDPIKFEVNIFNQVKDLKYSRSRIPAASIKRGSDDENSIPEKPKPVYLPELSQEVLIGCLRAFTEASAKRLNFRDDYYGFNQLYHKNIRHLSKRFYLICQHLYIFSLSGEEDVFPKSQATLWSRLMELIKMLGMNPAHESIDQTSSFTFKDNLAISRNISHRKNALALIKETMDDLDDYDCPVSYEIFFSSFLHSFPYSYPANITFSYEQINQHLDVDSFVYQQDWVESISSYGDFLKKDQDLANQITSIADQNSSALDDLMDLFPKVYSSYIETYGIETDNRHSLIQLWHSTIVEQLNKIKDRAGSESEAFKINKDLIVYIIGTALSVAPINTTVASFGYKNNKLHDISPTLKKVTQSKVDFKLQFIDGVGLIDVAEINGFLLETQNDQVQILPHEGIDRKSYIYNISDIGKSSNFILPLIRHQQRQEKKKNQLGPTRSIIFHQDYCPYTDLGFMGFLVGYKPSNEKDRFGRPKTLDQVKKIGVCDNGEVFFYDIDDESLIQHENKSFYMKYARPVSDDAYPFRQIEEWATDPLQTKDVFKMIKDKLKKITFTDEYAREYLTLWVMGTYFFRIFPTYPRVVLNQLPGQDGMFVMSLLSRLCFNGRALSEDDREISSILNIINVESPTLCIYASESRGATKRGLVELLNYQSPHRDIKALKSGRVVNHYSPVIHCLNRFEVRSDQASADSIRISLKKGLDTRGIQLDLDEIESERLKVWALTNMSKVAQAYRHMLNNSETLPRYLAMETMAQFVQSEGHRNLKNAISFYEEKVNNQQVIEKQSTVEMALVHTVLTNEYLWREKKETLFIPYDLMRNRMKAGASKTVKDQATSQKLKDLLGDVIKINGVEKSTRNDWSEKYKPTNPKNGFEVDQSKFKSFIEDLGKSIGYIGENGQYLEYQSDRED